MAKFKIVKHRLRYHVIGFEGTKTSRRKGVKPTYKEQCISSHYSLNMAKKALSKYENTHLQLSNKEEPKTFRHLLKEMHLAFWLAVVAAIGVEFYLKFIAH